MNDLDQYVASTQRWVTFAYVALLACAFASLVFLPKPLDETVKAIVVGIIASLTTVIVQQSNFWFARPRAIGVPNQPPVETPEGPPK